VNDLRYKIILDSSGELPAKYKNDERFSHVPLLLEIGDYRIRDDENFDQEDFLKRIASYDGVAKSACPSPEDYMEAYKADADRIYVITLSSHLSGSYNSAVLGKKLYEEEYGEKDIFVIDSKSASCGETQIGLHAMELEEQELSADEIKSELLRYRDEMSTYFVLDNLETLRKNGRMSMVKAMVAQTLSIKPIMMGDHGVIVQRGQSIGIKKALTKMVDMLLNDTKVPEKKRFMIAHCNCFERAELVKDLILKKVHVRDILIQDTAGLSSLYANDGGIIVTA